jgi:hypothetical protein
MDLTQFEELCNKNSPRGQLCPWLAQLVHPSASFRGLQG